MARVSFKLFSLLSFLTDCFFLRQKYPYSVTSWFRTIKRNKMIGGLPDSKHLTGFAIDIVPDLPKDYWEEIATEGRKFGLEMIVEDDHIHIEDSTNG